jgi:hypothetical protein
MEKRGVIQAGYTPQGDIEMRRAADDQQPTADTLEAQLDENFTKRAADSVKQQVQQIRANS